MFVKTQGLGDFPYKLISGHFCEAKMLGNLARVYTRALLAIPANPIIGVCETLPP